MALFRRSPRGPRVARGAAIGGRPQQLPVLGQEEAGQGELRLFMSFRTRRWQRYFGVPAEVKREFVLDPYGREVYEACDGKTTVKMIVRRFADSHKISQAEAEMSVTTFLKTLMGKGLIAITVDRRKKP